MVAVIPLNMWTASWSKKLQQKQMKLKDNRVKTMNELLNGIKVIKLYGWEESFMSLVLSLRNKEVRQLVLIAYLNAFSIFLWSCAPFLVTLASFAVYVLIDDKNVLNAEKAFVSLTYFNILRFPLTMLPNMISSLIITWVSVKRLGRYLNAPELDKYVERSKTGPALYLEDAFFAWDVNNGSNSIKDEKKEKKDESKDKKSEEDKSEDKNEPKDIITLKNINARVEKGSFTAIVGNVGSGKSSLVSAVLGDMEKIKGSVVIGAGVESIAYVPQQAWIQNVSLKDNILFGSPFDNKQYQQVINVCELKQDLEILPAGDETEIGEKGINLSGGQKQRVNLARACYSNSDLYLMDDPLSAVDAHVAKNLFDKVLSSKTGILRKKTRILVTNNLSILPFVDQILVMKNGTISETGSYKTLMSNRGDFADFVHQFSGRRESETSKEGGDEDDLRQRTFSKGSGGGDSRSQSLSQESPKKDSMKPTGDKKLIEQEKTETGKVKMFVYIQYFKSISVIWLVVILLGHFGNQASSAGANYWLSIWTTDEADNSTGIPIQDTGMRDYRLGIYALCGFLQAGTILVGSLALAKGSIDASVKLHKEVLFRILRSPMMFFDTTPIGRIVNRFAKDVDVVDTTIPQTMRDWIGCFLQVLATVVMIGIATPYFLLIILPIAVLYYFIQKFYIPTSRQLKRLESVTRSPIYSHFGETLSGVSTIRAYNVNDRFIRESDKRLDVNLSCCHCNTSSNRWLGVRLEFCANCIIMFAALFVVLNRETIDPGTVGLSLSYALSVTQTLNWAVRMTSEIETNIVSVERILEYTMIDTEAEWTQDKKKIINSWPDSGKIDFKNYGARYRPGLDLVIRDINISIQPEEKIGVVGRTGAGKSTITLSLFRIIEAAAGNIIIDGVNISEIGLHELRKKLTIIPQDPVLFSGTMRFNLDPFNEKSDQELWTCLEHAHLKDFVKSLDQGLDSSVLEGGENLSVGQRQLVCLARALLRKTKILILDEATAAVDLETDSLIQSTIRSEFSDCTIITIAHRLHTILDSTRVLVLDQGKVVEFDSPDKLLSNKSSVFYSLARNAGIKS